MEFINRRIVYCNKQDSGCAPVSASFCSCTEYKNKNGPVNCNCGEDIEVHEWAWDVELATATTLLSNDNREVRFHPGYSSGTAAIRGDSPFQQGHIYYWEIKMLTALYGTDVVFVLMKTWRTTPSRRHLFLGQMLLLGLFLCAAVAALLSAEPTVLTCAGVRLGAGLAYSLVFSTLLVKCVFLISLNGGVYLPAPYQALLLFFAVLIQLAIGAQWLINNPPKVIQVGLHQACHTPYHHLLLSLVYSVFLIVVVAVLAVKSRGIRDNYREATFIGLAVACVIPVWLGWALCGLVVLERNRDACLAFGLSGSAMIVFLIMFMPKGRQLAAMGREGMYVEDREEKFSSLSRAASPSFFHFKPVKQPPQLNTFGGSYSHSRTKICTVSDRVALVAPPPSYGHHYYPYCYYPRAMPGSGYDTSMYTTVEPTLSSNPNVFFHRGVHPGMMY